MLVCLVYLVWPVWVFIDIGWSRTVRSRIRRSGSSRSGWRYPLSTVQTRNSGAAISSGVVLFYYFGENSLGQEMKRVVYRGGLGPLVLVCGIVLG